MDIGMTFDFVWLIDQAQFVASQTLCDVLRHLRHTIRTDLDNISFVLRGGARDWVEEVGCMSSNAWVRVVGEGADCGG